MLARDRRRLCTFLSAMATFLTFWRAIGLPSRATRGARTRTDCHRHGDLVQPASGKARLVLRAARSRDYGQWALSWSGHASRQAPICSPSSALLTDSAMGLKAGHALESGEQAIRRNRTHPKTRGRHPQPKLLTTALVRVSTCSSRRAGPQPGKSHANPQPQAQPSGPSGL